MSQEGIDAGLEGGAICALAALCAPRDERQKILGGDWGAGGNFPPQSLPDMGNKPERAPDFSQPDIFDIDGGSEIKEHEDVMVSQSKRGRSRKDSGKSSSAAHKNLAALSYYYGTCGPASNNSEGCPVVPVANTKSSGGGVKRKRPSRPTPTEKKFACQWEGCNYRAALKGNLKRHMAHVHDVGVVWKYCDVMGCNFKAKERGSVKLHKMHVHDIGITWHYCNIKGCSYKSKTKGNLKMHKSMIHDIGVVWHCCDIDDCTYKSKHSSDLKRHKSDVHGIGVVWHYCDVEGCEYKAKHKGHVNAHKKKMHKDA